jgi:hypothetical protein
MCDNTDDHGIKCPCSPDCRESKRDGRRFDEDATLADRTARAFALDRCDASPICTTFLGGGYRRSRQGGKEGGNKTSLSVQQRKISAAEQGGGGGGPEREEKKRSKPAHSLKSWSNRPSGSPFLVVCRDWALRDGGRWESTALGDLPAWGWEQGDLSR